VCIGLEIWKDAYPGPCRNGSQPEEYMSLNDPPTGLKAADLRKINLGPVLRELWSYAQEEEQEARGAGEALLQRVIEVGPSLHIDPKKIQAILDQGPAFTKTPGVRRRTEDRSHFEKVAAIYRAAARSGAPTKAVQDAFGCSYSTATKWVRKARDTYRLLAPTWPGYASPVQAGDDPDTSPAFTAPPTTPSRKGSR
jgi:hypothetical protein